MKQEKQRKRYIQISAIAAAAVLVVVFAIYSAFTSVNKTIIDYNVTTIEELGKHDRAALNAAINNRWEYLGAVADVMQVQGILNIQDIPSFLHSELKRVPDAKSIALLDADGIMYGSNGLNKYDGQVFEAFLSSEGNFSVRYNSESESVILENMREKLVFGVPLDLAIGDTHIVALTASLDVNSLKKEMKVDSYNGQGFSSVIDLQGNYVVNVNEKHSFLTYDNFFNDYLNGEFDIFGSVNELRQKLLSGMDAEETITTVYEDNQGQIVLSVTPLGISDWFFVTSVPVSVFNEQTLSIIRMFLVLTGVIVLSLFTTVLFIVHNNRQMERLNAAKEQAANAAFIEEQNLKLKEQHTALEEALSMAQSANRAKTTFLNNMSHDIRTPMNAIIGFTALAAKHLGDKNAVEGYLSKIRQSCEHLMSLINDVLDMSRIESGKMKLSEATESLPEILKALRNIVQADITAKRLDFFIDAVDVSDENVVCDKLRLNQVLLNILSNAIKYTHPGGSVCLRIIETQKKDENDYARYEFRVKDTGIGMSEEYLKTVFDPFTRERSSTVSGIQGTGLGMAITKNIVDMMNGEISVTSKVNEGSEFVVKLAFKTVQGKRTNSEIRALIGLRGMVVDDDMNVCQSVSQMLRDIGMRSEWCMYGKEAVARTEEAMRIGDSFKVYIIDWLMPDMNGVETARRIRHVVGGNIPIIILTAYDWADIEKEAYEAGVTAFVNKPLFQSDLQRTLQSICGDTKKEEVKETGDSSLAGKRILLVEDNELNREIAIEILQEAGFELDTAEDGTVAVEKVKTCKPGQYDLILMDIQMPIMDGYQATCAIRALPEDYRASIPIIAMTANAFEDDKRKAIESGMNDHIAKPIDVGKLFETLKKVLT